MSPKPVTEYSTVYTGLKNVQGILEQLEQQHLAVACDEGVYRIAREIMLQHPNEFENIILCLGSFHLIKVVMGSIGKYIEASGPEQIWIQNRIFEVNVVLSVLFGTNYNRSLKGLCQFAECIH